MTSHAWRLCGAIFAALSLAPIAALADGFAPAVERPTPHDSLTGTSPREVRQAHAAGPQIPVNLRITRDLGNGCTYLATLRGQYRPRKRTRGVGFDPRLTLNAHVVCGQHVHASAPTALIHGRDLTGRQLADSLAMHGRVLAVTGPRECTYTPSFSVSGSHIEAHAVWQACTTAIGGGPRSHRH